MDDYETVQKIIIAILAAAIAYFFTERRSSKQNSFELNREFHTDEFLKSRTKANQLLKGNRESDIASLEALDDFRHLSRVLHFFANIESLKRGHLIDKKLAKAFFQRYFDFFDQYVDTLFAINEKSKRDEWSSLHQELLGLRKWQGESVNIC